MLVLLLILLFYTAQAHELWIEREGNLFVLLYGHIKPDRVEEATVRYLPEQVLSFECLDAEGNRLKAELIKGYPLKLRGSCHMVQAVFSSGYWAKTPEGLKNLPKDQVKDSIESWYSLEIARRINAWKPRREPLSNELEIIPVESPSSLRVGEKFTVIAYYRGKPFRDVPVYHNGRIVGSTDEEGRINLRVREKGIQLVGVTVREKDGTGKADYVLKTFYLIFEVER